jgi:hypothetical protein
MKFHEFPNPFKRTESRRSDPPVLFASASSEVVAVELPDVAEIPRNDPG